MTQIANLTVGASTFDEPFKRILDDSGVEKDEFEGLDYFTWLPFFVIAGATITPSIMVHGDHTHFNGASIDVPEDQLELFYDHLPHLLAQVVEVHEGREAHE